MLQQITAFLLLLNFFLINKVILQEKVYPIWSIKRLDNKIALTFDDGPKPAQSSAILDILDKFGIKATFFLVGKEIKLYPDIIQRITDSGHEIANHSFSHNRLDVLTKKQIELELSATSHEIRKITGNPVLYMRPPGGRYNRDVINIADKLNLKVILWNVNAGDYTASSPLFEIQGESKFETGEYNRHSSKIIDQVIKETTSGSIILFHNGGEETIRALPEIIKSFIEKEFLMVTISELLAPESSHGFFSGVPVR